MTDLEALLDQAAQVLREALTLADVNNFGDVVDEITAALRHVDIATNYAQSNEEFLDDRE